MSTRTEQACLPDRQADSNLIARIDPANPPVRGTVFIFPAGAKAGRQSLPARLTFHGIIEGDCLELQEEDGAPWPDGETNLSVDWWNTQAAGQVTAVVDPDGTECQIGPPGGAAAARRQAHARGPKADLVLVRIADIDEGPDLRMEGKDEGLDLLGASIRELGMLQPVVVRKVGSRLRLVAGHRRLQAAAEAGEELVEAKVYDHVDERWEAAARLAENLQRKDLNHVELSRVFAAAAAAGMTVSQIAAEGHVSDDMVRRHLAVARLCEPVQRLVASGRLPVHQAELISRVGDPAGQIELAEEAVGMDWDPRKATWKEWQHGDKQYAADYVRPMENLREWVARKLRGLAACGWPMDAPYAGKPACTGCADNTATYADQPALFAGIEPRGSAKKGFCTNAACYEAKTKAREKARTAERGAKAKALKAAIAKAKRAGLDVCHLCGKLAGDGDKFAASPRERGGKLCPGCAAKKAKRTAPRPGSYEERQKEIAAMKARFPWTGQQRYALALWCYGEGLSKAIEAKVASGSQRSRAVELILALRLRPIRNRDYVEGAGLKAAPRPQDIAGGKSFTGKQLAALWRCTGYLGNEMQPGVRTYEGLENVPLEAEALEAIGLLEAVAKAWKVAMPKRPVERDFMKAEEIAAAKALTTIATGNKDAALKALGTCEDLEGLGGLGDLKGDWRRAAVSKRIEELEKAKEPPPAEKKGKART